MAGRDERPGRPLTAGAAGWELIAGWLGAGARWVFVPAVTVDYYQVGVPGF